MKDKDMKVKTNIVIDILVCIILIQGIVLLGILIKNII